MVDEALRRLEVLLPAGSHRPVRPEGRRMQLMKAAFAAYGKWVGDVGVPQGSTSDRVTADVRKIVERVSKSWKPPPEPADVDHVTKLLVSELLGVGPIEDLLHEPDISEIMVNGPSNVLVERRGRIEQTEIVFRDAEHLVSTIRRIADRSGRRIDYASPTLDSFLEDGSRVHALLPPLALDGPCLTIRKFGVVRAQLDDLITRETLNTEMAYFLAACVKARLNIIIGGPASSGKTTTMNALAAQVPENERMVTIEEVAEMDLSKAHSHVVRLQARGPNVEGRGEVTIRQLVREALRMRADRIIVGEARGEEMVEVLQALRCGHDGSMATIHASSPEDLVERAVTIALFANLGLSDETLRRMVVDGVDVIVFQYRFPDGQRKIIRISEPYRNARGEVAMNDVFIFDQLGYDPAGRAQGRFKFAQLSRHQARFERQGIVIPWDQLSRGEEPERGADG
jgi:pilus assembly protein CpaF